MNAHSTIRILQGAGLGGVFHPRLHKLTKPKLLAALAPAHPVVRPGVVELGASWFDHRCAVAYNFDGGDNLLSLSATFLGEPADQRRAKVILTAGMSLELRRITKSRWSGRGVVATLAGKCTAGRPLKLGVFYWEPEPSCSPVP